MCIYSVMEKRSFLALALVLLVAIITFKAHRVAANDENEIDLIKSCEYITLLSNEANEAIYQFSSVIPQNEIGYAVEFIFRCPLEYFQANASLTAYTATVVSEHSKSHWIVSVEKTKKLEVKKAEFELKFSNSNDVELTGIILNAEVLCGSGESKIYTTKSQQYDGHKQCKANIRKRYEHETAITIEEMFFSERVGLVIDVVFSSEVDSLKPGAKFYRKKHSKRHYSLINSGYMTSKDEPVKVDINIVHTGRPTPGISTIIMNDVVLCGFAPSHHVYDQNALSQISTVVEVEEESLNSLKTLILSSNIISGCSLLIAVVTGAFAWRLTRPEEKEETEEPVYSRPNKY